MPAKRIYKAATVILLSSEGKVLLTKRKESLKFLGGFHVYPGGRVDDGDYDSVFEDIIPYYLIDRIMKQWFTNNKREVIAHIVAGIREVFEEVGFLLLEGGKIRNLREIRWKIVKGEMNFVDMVGTNKGFSFNRDLEYIAHWITPPIFPVQFDTRFFLVKIDRIPEIEPNFGEVESYCWIEPDKALRKQEEGEIKLMPPTFYTLSKINKILASNS